jgi:BlaI family penicillinase repressor
VTEPNTESLTPAEWKVMKIVWRRRKCAARDVYEEAGRAFGWAPTTAKTVLRRLVEKGHLTAEAVGNSFLYRPSPGAVKSSLLGAADALLDNVVEGMSGLVLTHLVRRSRLSGAELKELRELLERRQTEEDGDVREEG